MIALRPISLEDLTPCWALRTRAVAHACAAHYGADVLAVWLAAPLPERVQELVARGGGIAAEEAGRMLGYAVLDAVSGEVDAVFVEPDAHGRGIGKLLMEAIDKAARAAGCERLFLSASLNAVPFYERAGFVVIREEMYPHRSGVDIPSVFMEKRLDATSALPVGGRVS